MEMDELNLISEKIIRCAFEVSNKLGAGFLEKVYENAMVIELNRAGLSVKQQAQLLNYLKATGAKLGLIINFNNPKVEIKRMLNTK